MSSNFEIFVVDDNSADIRILKDFSPPTFGGCHFSVSLDGEDAINYVRARGKHSQRPMPDVVILDLNLPRKSGTEVLAEIRSNPTWSKIPVVVLSGSDDPKDKANCLSLGANSFVTKPSSLEGLQTLFAVIQEYVTSEALQSVK